MNKPFMSSLVFLLLITGCEWETTRSTPDGTLIAFKSHHGFEITTEPSEGPKQEDPLPAPPAVTQEAHTHIHNSTTQNIIIVPPPVPAESQKDHDPVASVKPHLIGCSDNTREGFRDIAKHPDIAACAGGWSIPGIHHNGPACDRKSGNHSDNPTGEGCNVEDLCAPGFHVCLNDREILAISQDGCEGIDLKRTEPGFYLTRESSRGHMKCSGKTDFVGTDDIFGCGNLGCPVNPEQRGCYALNRSSHDSCSALISNCECSIKDDKIVCKNSSSCHWCKPPGYYEYINNTDYASSWYCGKISKRPNDFGETEALDVIKKTAELGGVLCCRDGVTIQHRSLAL